MEQRVGIEIERRYIIKIPSERDMRAEADYTRSEILQVYLTSDEGEVRRIRRREFSGDVRFFETVKKRLDGVSAVEREREITEGEFSRLLSESDPARRPIKKVRHSFRYLGNLFEIDVYPEWVGTAILENELPSRDSVATPPPFIKVIREITGEREYSNAALALSFPPEENYL